MDDFSNILLIMTQTGTNLSKETLVSLGLPRDEYVEDARYRVRVNESGEFYLTKAEGGFGPLEKVPFVDPSTAEQTPELFGNLSDDIEKHLNKHNEYIKNSYLDDKRLQGYQEIGDKIEKSLILAQSCYETSKKQSETKSK